MSPDRLAERFGPHVLREYALLADGERGALIGPLGDVAWLCFPSWGDDALLSSLIGGGGAYAVTPSARCVWGGYYERGSLIWRSRWITDEGIVECREALAMPGRRGRAVLLRRVIAVSGDARVRVLLELRGAFGRRPAWDLARDDEGAWRGRTGDHHFCWAGAAGASVGGAGDGQALSLDLEVEAGSHHDLVLALDARREPQAPEPQGAWTGTEAAWAERVPRFEQTMAPRDARHAYAVLAGLTSSGGGMVAAATTSLPERGRAGNSYDYRYVWIHEQDSACLFS
ncbi:MAG: trehalase-like domain-containing protein, partial [Thermoleophilaceae bacterium]